MSAYGIRGPFADFMFTGVRLGIDQTAENVTGVGALPWWVLPVGEEEAGANRCRTWPVDEQVLDLWHKAVFSLVTGYLCDRWIQ